MVPVENDNQVKAERVIRLAKWFAIAGLLIALLIVNVLGLMMHEKYDRLFARVGQAGDVTGGITGPILNFCGMLIVYYSLREQLRANTIQSDLLKNELDSAKHQKRIREVEGAIATAQEEIVAKADSLRKWTTASRMLYGPGLKRPYTDIAPLTPEQVTEYTAQQNHEVSQLRMMISLLVIATRYVEDLRVSADDYITDPDRSHCLNLLYRKCLEPFDGTGIYEISNKYWYRLEDPMRTLFVTISDAKKMRDRFYSEYLETVRSQLKEVEK